MEVTQRRQNFIEKKKDEEVDVKNKRKTAVRVIKYFYIPFIIMMLTTTVCTFYFSIDSFWMAYEGGKTITKEYVQQQWLFNIIVNRIYSIIGWKNSILFQTSLVIIIYAFYLEYSRDKIKGIILLSTFSFYFYSAYTFRPWIISIACMIFTYEITKDEYSTWKQIIVISLSSIIMANCESAYLPFLYIFIGVRLFDSVIERNFNKFFKYVMYIILSFSISLINPYGIDAILYVFEGVGKANELGIIEMSPINIISIDTVTILFSLYMILWKRRKKCSIGEKICVIVSSLLTIYMRRNSIILGVASYMIIRRNIKSTNVWTSMEKKKVELNCFRMYLAMLAICAVYFTYTSSFRNINELTLSDESIEVLKNECTEETSIYNNLNVGGYLEYSGIPCCMGDVRPELLDDELREYWMSIYNNENGAVSKMLNRYEFDIILLKPNEMISDALIYREISSYPYEKIFDNGKEFIYRRYG